MLGSNSNVSTHHFNIDKVLASEYELHPNRVGQWKRQLLAEGAAIFDSGASQQQQRDQAQREAQLYEQIGRLKMEVEWLKKYPALLKPNGG